MINGEQSLCWPWFIHHVSQEVKPRGAAMSEETPHVATRKEEATWHLHTCSASGYSIARLLPLVLRIRVL